MITLLAPRGEYVAGDVIELDDEETRHVQVRRAQEHDEATVIDGAGRIVHGTLSRGMKRWHLHAVRVETKPAPAPLVLAVGAGDRDRFLWIAEKCAELSVSRLIPLQTERQRNSETRLRETGLDRARRRAQEACKQSGNPWFPIVEDLQTLDALERSMPWLLADAGGGSCPDIASDAPIGWLVGPEGGFTPAEITFCRESLGAMGASLAPAVLRFETAAIVAAALTLDRRAASQGGTLG